MSKPINLEVRPRKDESPERMIRRFFRTLKKEEIIEEYIERTKYYKKPSEIKNNTKKKRKLINKVKKDQKS